MSQPNNSDSMLERWTRAEQWFLRGVGVVLLVTMAIAAFSGFLQNPDDDVRVRVVNLVIALLLGAAGAWGLWQSMKVEKIRQMVERYSAQAPNRMRVTGAISVVIALMFFLDGLSRAGFATLLIGILLLVAAVWYFWRAEQADAFQKL